jgi:hypothetical protein
VQRRVFDETGFSFDMDQVWGQSTKDKGRFFITTKLTHSYKEANSLGFNCLLMGVEFRFVIITHARTKVTEQITPTPVLGFVLVAIPTGGIYLFEKELTNRLT